MTATNHVLTGSLLGLTLHQPLLAVPLALLSHFVLDALPHYGDKNHVHDHFKTILMLDMLIASMVLVALILLRPAYWQLGLVCGIVAASPDLMWLPMWLRELKNKRPKFENIILRFHKNIQWAERAHNYPVEVVWFVAGLFLLAKHI